MYGSDGLTRIYYLKFKLILILFIFRMKEKEVTEKILRAYHTVYNTLGYGFLERVYENAMLIELKKQGLDCIQQKAIDVYYDCILVGEYYADIVVNNLVIVELKSVENLKYEHECQLTNYLKATDIEIGLILNFGKKPEFKRKIFTNKSEGGVGGLNKLYED